MFIAEEIRASVVEHSIGFIFAVLTDIGSESGEMRDRTRSASADGQTVHEKRNALVGDSLGRRRERPSRLSGRLEGLERVSEPTCPSASSCLSQVIVGLD